MHMAARVGNLTVVKLLIKEKALVAKRCKVSTMGLIIKSLLQRMNK